MKRNTEMNADSADLQLVRMLVAKHLRDRGAADGKEDTFRYELAPTKRWHAAAGELHVNVDLGRGARPRRSGLVGEG
ncbi:hypothetical protein [Sphingomonas sp. BAUL-RG-20F-R05-02]|uniref:hypothetical protein n=1 Tax=Sphingomonas sp. BAUL-RG-20F-R05-02 TaxID=2914830 RepID=UPI001F59C227|nr:hypothetical protein [Sphingomonas sp. BAUL-RG-20F-R05-02]